MQDPSLDIGAPGIGGAPLQAIARLLHAYCTLKSYCTLSIARFWVRVKLLNDLYPLHKLLTATAGWVSFSSSLQHWCTVQVRCGTYLFLGTRKRKTDPRQISDPEVKTCPVPSVEPLLPWSIKRLL